MAQEAQREGKGGAIPRAQVTIGHQITAGGAEWLQEAPKSYNMVTSSLLSSILYICFRKTSVSNMGATILLLVPGAI